MDKKQKIKKLLEKGKETKQELLEEIIILPFFIIFLITTFFYVDLVNIYNCVVTYNYGVWICNSTNINEFWLFICLILLYLIIKLIYYTIKKEIILFKIKELEDKEE